MESEKSLNNLVTRSSESVVEYKDIFQNQFGDIIGNKLKKKLEKVQNLEQK